MTTFDPTLAGTIFVGFVLLACLAILLWPERAPKRWQPPVTRDADIAREREALLSASARIGLAEGVRMDLMPVLDAFAEGLAERVADGRTARAVAIQRITRKAQRLAGPGSASEAALAIRQAQGVEDAP